MATRPTHRSVPGPVKVGIDVGGTFTHAVALDARTLSVVGKAVVPTTHRAKEGVARGVVEALNLLLKSAKIHPRRVALIAHSTTQATNALLEGDVARVGIIGLGTGFDGWQARRQTNIGSLELAPGKFLRTSHRFHDTAHGIDPAHIKVLVHQLADEGAEAFVVSEVFGVDDPDGEHRVADEIRAMGFPVTEGTEISQLYGLRVRTRTAVLNASMLPRMIATATMTERAVRSRGITAPLMIMRSDGGIMSIEEMRRRPILTMLSGPAAGVAAALMFVKVSDGIFCEVGGTSTDITVIRNGRPMVRSAEIGGHRLYFRTLDIRTVGIGGGSMVRAEGSRVIDVGPRSAHIAGLRYPSFTESHELSTLHLTAYRPAPDDPPDYLAFRASAGSEPGYALTVTEAANLLGLARGYARGREDSLRAILPELERWFHMTPAQIAATILDKAAEKLSRTVQELTTEYHLDPRIMTLVGGGGGAETVVPRMAEALGLQHRMADHAEVISAIGTALGMIRDSVERTVVQPTDSDILRIRSDASDSVIRMGADPGSVNVHVEVDARRKRLIATATGAPELRMQDLRVRHMPDQKRLEMAAQSLGSPDGLVRMSAGTRFLHVYETEQRHPRWFGLSTRVVHPIRVVDHEGIIRLKLPDGEVHAGRCAAIAGELGRLIDARIRFGDAGGILPDVYILAAGRIIDCTGLATGAQVLSLVRIELEGFPGDEPAVALIAGRG